MGRTGACTGAAEWSKPLILLALCDVCAFAKTCPSEYNRAYFRVGRLSVPRALKITITLHKNCLGRPIMKSSLDED